MSRPANTCASSASHLPQLLRRHPRRIVLLTLSVAALASFCLVSWRVSAAGGGLDPAFNGNGTVTINFGRVDIARATAIQPDGKIVIVGHTNTNSTNNRDTAVTRLNADGTLDTGFAAGGKYINAQDTTFDLAAGVAIQSDSKIVVAGITDGGLRRLVFRLNTDGTLDTSFGSNGIFTTPISPSATVGSNDTDTGIRLQPDGKIVVVGSAVAEGGSNNVFSVIRLNTNGSLDASFDGDGKVETAFANARRVAAYDVALQPDGKIIAAGEVRVDTSASVPTFFFAATRYNTDGSLDTSFDGDGKATPSFSSCGYRGGSAEAVALQPDGKIILAGTAFAELSGPALLRLNADGAVDTSFGCGGLAVIRVDSSCQTVTSIGDVHVKNGKIIATGTKGPVFFDNFAFSDHQFLVMQFGTNGSPDLSFGTNGVEETDIFIGSNDLSNESAFQADGKLIVVGQSDNDFVAARYLGVGTTDPATTNPTDCSACPASCSGGSTPTPTPTPTATPGSCAAPPANMTAWYPGDGDANDIQGGNHGTLRNGATFAAGKVAQAFSLDGVDDYVEIANSPNVNPTAAITIDAWINPDTIKDGSKIISKDFSATSCSGNPNVVYQLEARGLRGNRATFFFTTADGIQRELVGTSVLQTGVFTHVAATYDGTTARIYVNGVLENSLAASGALRTSTTPAVIGNGGAACRAQFGGQVEFDGLIDEVEIFDRALSQSEIQAIVNAGSAGKCKTGATPTPTPTATPTPTPAPGVTVQFSQATFSVTEGCVPAALTVTLSGSPSGPVAVDYTVAEGTAKQKTDFTYVAGTLLPDAAQGPGVAALLPPAPTAVSGTLLFAAGETEKEVTVLITEDGFAEGTEDLTVTLLNPRGAALGGVATSLLDINDNETVDSQTNPIDDPGTYVCQLYHDFLHRQPDPAGRAFWTEAITRCGADQPCVGERRHDVAAAFFLSIEFQQTGYFVYRAYETALDRRPQYEEFMRDLNAVALGVEVGVGDWEQRLSAQRRAFAAQVVGRSEFNTRLPEGTEAGAFADKLFQQAGASPTQSEREAVVTAYGVGNTEGRAAALLAALDAGSVYNRLYNPGFVLIEYFGFMRRDPDDPPDGNLDGYNFWLGKMDSFTLAGEDARLEQDAFERIKRAEMVRAFIVSMEYRQRFGP